MRSFSRTAAHSGLALLLFACGGEDLGKPAADLVPSTAEPLDPCSADEGYEFQRIVDFEPGQTASGAVSRSAFCDPATPCSFYFNADTANSPPGGCAPELTFESTPRVGQGGANIPGQELPQSRCGESTGALHVTATNMAICINDSGRKGWGGGFDITFSSPLDASEWDGISFWVKRGTTPGFGNNRTDNKSIIALAIDQYSSGATCDASDPALATREVPDTEKCDPFGAAAPLRDEWTFIPAKFSAMRQKGFGVPSPLGHVDTTGLIRFQILMTAGNWDFWIDDISLFRAPAE